MFLDKLSLDVRRSNDEDAVSMKAPLTTAQAAARLDVTPRVIHYLVATGRLKPISRAPGGRGPYLFTVADIDALEGYGA